MRWLVVVVLCAGWAWTGMTNAPRVDQPMSSVFGLAVASSCALSWWAGRRSGRAAAVAVAVAHAEARAAALARSQSNAAAQAAVVVNIDQGARTVAAREVGGLDRAEWIGDAHPLLEQDASEVDLAQALALDGSEETAEVVL